MRVASFTPLPLYPRGKHPFFTRYLKGLVGRRADLRDPNIFLNSLFFKILNQS
jgi:hypothetical protein